MPWPLPMHTSLRGKADALGEVPSFPPRSRRSGVKEILFCSMISRRPTSIVPTVHRSALVPVASPAMCFTSGSGASSRSIFNDLFAVIRLFQPPCALRSRTPYLLGFAYGQPPFSGLATEQRLATRFRHLATFARGLVSPPSPSRKYRIDNCLIHVNNHFAFCLKL